MLFFTIINHFLEIKKWKTLTKSVKNNSWFEATEQSLASLTFSIITPNRIGEYGAKALFFEGEKRKNIMGLNLIGNLSQLAATIFFGCIGIIYFLMNFPIEIPKINIQNSLILVVFLFILIYFRNKTNVIKVKAFLNKINYTKKMNAYVFPGQGAQFTGMGMDLYEASQKAKDLLKYNPQFSLQQGLKEAVKWYWENL